jgi:hypothetical protein
MSARRKPYLTVVGEAGPTPAPTRERTPEARRIAYAKIVEARIIEAGKFIESMLPAYVELERARHINRGCQLIWRPLPCSATK